MSTTTSQIHSIQHEISSLVKLGRQSVSAINGLLRISARGLPEVIALGDIDIVSVLDPVVRRGSLGIEQRMETYPSPRGSRYPRTYQLQRGWGSRFERSERMSRGSTENAVPYAPWVQAKETQARVHRGYWGTDADAVDVAAPDIAQDAERAIDEALR